MILGRNPGFIFFFKASFRKTPALCEGKIMIVFSKETCLSKILSNVSEINDSIAILFSWLLPSRKLKPKYNIYRIFTETIPQIFYILTLQENLKVALIQKDLIWENANENLQKIEAILVALDKDVDLIVLPEMFTTGFSMEPTTLAEPMEGRTVEWMLEQAKILNVALTGSIIIKENSSYYNRLLFVHPSGKIDFYDKKHAFAMAGEDKEYSSGTSKLIVDFKGWKICPLICYDLRFPVWAKKCGEL